MNRQRVWIVALAVGAGVMLASWYVQNRRGPAAADGNGPSPSSATAPASKPATAAAAGTATAPSTAPVSGSAPASGTTTAASAPGQAARPRWYEKNEPPAQLFSLGSVEPDANYPFQLEMTNEGAAVFTLKLTDYFATVDDKKLADRYRHDRARYWKEVAASPGKYRGNYCLLNPVLGGPQRHLPFSTDWITIWFPDARKEWDLRRRWTLAEGPTTHPDGSQTIRFEWTLLHNPNYADPNAPDVVEPLLTITKTYTVRKGDYSVGLSLAVKNHSKMPLRFALDQAGPTGVPGEQSTTEKRDVVLGRWKEGAFKKAIKLGAELSSMALGEPNVVGYSEGADGQRTLWIAEVSKFFGSIMYLRPKDANGLYDPDVRARFSVAAASESGRSWTYATSVTLGVSQRDGRSVDAPIQLGAGETVPIAFDIFAGPKKRGLFLDNPLYNRLSYLNTIEFGTPCCGVSWFNWCTFDWLTLAMMWLLDFFARIPPHNYGIAIILLVILVRVVLHPLTRKGQVMMARTQKLAPAMAKLKAKYADDKDALQKEMMKLYKSQGATPLLGCLPMMLQMPIWIALWSALNAAVELRQAAFLPFWLTDLASPDAAFTFGFSLPLIGNSLNLLPILGCFSTYIQMRLNPQMAGAAPAATPDQQKQQALMRYMMPVMMVFFFYSMPSGLNLYIMASGFIGALEQWVIRRHMEAREAAQAAAVTTVAMPGKAPRGNRTKKPKGPFWVKRG